MKKITRRSFLKVAGISAAAMGLAACGSSSSTASTATASSAAASTASSAAAATGKVYYLNFKPESDSGLAGSGQEVHREHRRRSQGRHRRFRLLQ
jgi:raffinose/stachyose/melibiose transport system substrate-binding protein